jgi:hypothetical protein
LAAARRVTSLNVGSRSARLTSPAIGVSIMMFPF